MAPGRPRYKRPASVLVLVCTGAGEVLLLNRVDPPGFWQSVTGSLEPGESPRRAAERELLEETGLRAAGRLLDCRRGARFPIRPPWRARYAPGVRYNREHWFLLLLPQRHPVRLNRAEHSACRWLPWRQAATRASSWTNRAAIRLLLGRSFAR